MISVDVLEGRSALESIAGEWEELLGDSFTASFCQPAWHLAWLDAYRAGKIGLVTARQGNRLVGVLPLTRSRSDSRGLFFSRITPVAYGDYQPPVVAPDFAAEAVPAMLD